MHDSLAKLLWRLSEAGEPAVMLGRQHAPGEDAAFQRMLALGVLVHGISLTDWDPCSDCDCGAEERRIRWIDGAPVAACAADHRRDAKLDPDDVRTFNIQISALVHETATASGFGQAELTAPGLWRLGQLSDGRVLVAAPTRAGLLQPGLVGALRMVDREGPIILIAPSIGERQRALLASQGVHHVLPSTALAGPGEGTAMSIDVGRLPDGRSGSYLLVLTAATRAVRFGGKEASLPSRPFQLLHILARQHRRGKPTVSRHALHKEIFGNTTAEAAVRDLMAELRRKMKQAFGGGGDVAQLIETKTTTGYAIALPPLSVALVE